MRPVLILASLWALLASVALGQTSPLAALTPRGAGLYIELREPSNQAQAFLSGELGRRVRDFAPVARWREQQLPGVVLIAREVSRRLDVPLEELRDDVFGGEVALALWPVETLPTDDASPVHGLVLIRSRTAAALEKTLAGLDQAQKASGELVKVEAREHAGAKYKARHVKRGGKEVVEFYAVQENLAAASNDESLMHRFLTLRGRPQSENLLDDPVLGARLEQTSPEAVAAVVFDPRPWRGLVARARAAVETTGDDHQRVEARRLAMFLDSVHGAVASIDVRSGVVVDVRFDLIAGKLPPQASAVLTALSGAAEWKWAPRGALVVLAGRADAAFFLRTALANADEKAQEDWKKLRAVGYGILDGLKLFDDVLAKLGPSGVLFVAPRESSGDGAFPLDVAAAIEFQSGVERDDRPATSETIDQALRSLLHVSAAVQNAESPDSPAVVRTKVVNNVRITVLQDWRELPKGLAIAYAAQPTLFVVGTSVGAAAGAVDRSPADAFPAEASALFASSLDSRPPSHVAYFNLAAARTFMVARRADLVTWIASAKNAPPERVERSLDQLTAVLELADSAAFVQRVSPDCVSFTVRIVVESSEPAAE